MKGAHSLLNVQVPRIKQVAPQLFGTGTKHRHIQQVTENQGFYQIIKICLPKYSREEAHSVRLIKKCDVWCTLSTYNTNNYCIIVCAMNLRFHTQPALLFFAFRKNIVFQTEKIFRLKLKRTTIT